MYNTPDNQAASTFPAIFYRSYSRRFGEPGSEMRESWDQAIGRTFHGICELGNFTPKEKEMILDHMANCKTLPSGRWMWVGGTDWIKDPKNFGGSYNCFQGDTEVVTLEYGNVAIYDIVGLPVHVLNKNNQWTPTKFTEYGEQKLMQVTLRRKTERGASKLINTVLATAEHNWHTSDGLVLKTKDLTGSVLPNVIAEKPSDESPAYKAGLVHGMVYGDGSVVGSAFIYSSHKIRLCSEKKELLPFFDGRKTIYCPSYNGDPLVFVDGDEFFAEYAVEDLKQLPISVSDPSYLLGFFRGLLATDGSVCSSAEGRLAAEIIGTPDTCEFLKKISPIIGIQGYIRNRVYNKGDVTNFGARKQEGSAFVIRPVTLTTSDTLRKLHHDKLTSGKIAADLGWNVLAVDDTEITEKVYCCIEPITNTFVLADGILTGNCSSIDFDDPSFFGILMRMAMEGTGTGAVLEPKYTNKLPPISTLLDIKVQGAFGMGGKEKATNVFTKPDGTIVIEVGDSRQGWADSVNAVMEIAMSDKGGTQKVTVDYSRVRPKGAKLSGFGGTANPTYLPALYPRLQTILNGAIGRKMNPVEICLAIDECSKVVVAGGIRRCLPETALVHTSKGLVQIKDVQIGDMVQTPAGFRKVTNKFDQGEQNVYDVSSNGGFTRATINHKYAVLRGIDHDDNPITEWIPLSDIKENDRLLFNRKVLPGTLTHLPADFTAIRPKGSTTCGHFQVAELDSEVAWFIGYTHGNGCIQITRDTKNKNHGHSSWSFNRNYNALGDALSERLIAAIKKFGCNATRSEVGGENTSVVKLKSMRFAEYFQRYIKKPNIPMIVPDFILQGTSDIRAAYMAGLYDSDGAQNNRPAIAVTTIYTEFARQITAVLGSLGVPCRLNMTIEADRPGARPKHNVTLPSMRFLFNDRIAPYSCKGAIKDGAHEAHGFSIPTELIKSLYTPAVIRSRMGAECPAITIATSNVSFKKYIEYTSSSMDIPITFKGLSTVDVLPTWDIEVEGEHCFYCDGYLVHNSAGMRQFASDDAEAMVAKDNLWQQDEAGNWRIDPDRDALRMANHTRVFHHKPKIGEIKESVRKQFLSGEGAIQYAPEALVRANADILTNPTEIEAFEKAYAVSPDRAASYILNRFPDMPQQEVEHRLSRYGMNPCLVAGTMVRVKEGTKVTARPIEDLVGKTVTIWDGKEWVLNSGFRITGNDQNVYRLLLNNGEEVIATEYHKFLVETGFTDTHGSKVQLTCLTPGTRLIGADGSCHAEVESVTHVGIVKNVYCTTVPSTGAFALESGLMSGNCFSPGTMVMTRKGHFPIEDLVGETVEVWDGYDWIEIDNFRVTARNQEVYTVTTGAGETITATNYHRFVLSDGTSKLLHELKPGDRLMTHDVRIHGIHHEPAAYLKGFLIGDGTERQGFASLDLYHPKFICEDRLLASRNEIRTLVKASVGGRYAGKSIVEFGSENNGRKNMSGFACAEENLLPWVKEKRSDFPMETLNWDLPSKLDFISGIMDADGTALDTATAFGYQLSSVHEKWLLGFQTLLHTIGVNSSVKMNKPSSLKDFGTRGGICKVQSLYRLTISQNNAIRLSEQCIFTRLKSFVGRTTKKGKPTNNNRVESISFSRVEPEVYCCTVPTNHQFSLSNSIVIGQCGEIIGSDFFCNLSEIHLNQLNPWDFTAQINAFHVGGLIAAALLHHNFENERQQYSRSIDPIVGVSFTGAFDFFVNMFGVDWLRWWQADRVAEWDEAENLDYIIQSIPEGYRGEFWDCMNNDEDYTAGDVFFAIERLVLGIWREAAEEAVWEYCHDHQLRTPNRCTTVQPAGSKSLLTGSSPGWHPPKGSHYIRRITFQAKDPLAETLMMRGYSIIPGQSDKDDMGNLLDDPYDPRCTEWLVEIPVEMSWGSLSGADEIDINAFSAAAQFNFYMQVQRYYTTHNTSATIELRENEINEVAHMINNAIGDGYISATLLPRSDAPFPRMPFEVITRERYHQMSMEVAARAQIADSDILPVLRSKDNPSVELTGPAQCDSDKCLN